MRGRVEGDSPPARSTGGRRQMPVSTERTQVGTPLTRDSRQHRSVERIRLGAIATFARALTITLFAGRFFHFRRRAASRTFVWAARSPSRSSGHAFVIGRHMAASMVDRAGATSRYHRCPRSHSSRELRRRQRPHRGFHHLVLQCLAHPMSGWMTQTPLLLRADSESSCGRTAVSPAGAGSGERCSPAAPSHQSKKLS
jgi:hypothetical protein